MSAEMWAYIASVLPVVGVVVGTLCRSHELRTRTVCVKSARSGNPYRAQIRQNKGLSKRLESSHGVIIEHEEIQRLRNALFDMGYNCETKHVSMLILAQKGDGGESAIESVLTAIGRRD